MGKRISNDKREAIVIHKKAGATNADICKWLLVTEGTVINVWKKYLATGTHEPYPSKGGRKPKVSEEEIDEVVAQIKKTPDMTLTEMIEMFDLPIVASTLCMRLQKRKITLKKRRYTQAGKNEKM